MLLIDFMEPGVESLITKLTKIGDGEISCRRLMKACFTVSKVFGTKLSLRTKIK